MYKLDEHEKQINDLTQFLKVEGIDQAKVSTIIQGLRDNYTEVNTSIEDTTKQLGSLKELNEGLRSANMNLLSKLGTSISDFGKKEDEKKKEDEQPNSDIKSLEDIAKEFLK